MTNKFNHAIKIKGIQPAKLKSLVPGMIITFGYGGKNIFDKKPLVLFLYYDSKTKVMDGLNLNYLSNHRLKILFDGFETRTSVSVQGEEESNLLNEDYTFIEIPSPKKLQTKSKSEFVVEMSRMYKKFLKPKYSDIYRSYKFDKIQSLKVVNIRV